MQPTGFREQFTIIADAWALALSYLEPDFPLARRASMKRSRTYQNYGGRFRSLAGGYSKLCSSIAKTYAQAAAAFEEMSTKTEALENELPVVPSGSERGSSP